MRLAVIALGLWLLSGAALRLVTFNIVDFPPWPFVVHDFAGMFIGANLAIEGFCAKGKP